MKFHRLNKETSRKIPPHPNVVMFRGICEDPVCIIVDYCDGGSLYSYLHSNVEISDESKLKFVTEIVRGRKFL